MNNYNENEDNHDNDDAVDYVDNALYLNWHGDVLLKLRRYAVFGQMWKSQNVQEVGNVAW